MVADPVGQSGGFIVPPVLRTAGKWLYRERHSLFLKDEPVAETKMTELSSAHTTQDSEAQGTASAANAMWGGRFSSSPSALMEAINVSIGFDRRLAEQDLLGSMAHSDMLAAQGIISTADRNAIHDGLRAIAGEVDAGTFVFSKKLEDIHMNIEGRLKTLIGDAAGRLHTARSRNDQVALDFRLWVREAHDRTDAQLTELLTVLVDQAERHADVIMPGFTHLQSAQPVTFGHHLLAYAEMFGRDRSRIRDSRTRLNECPLGACALAGTSFPIDRSA